MFFNRQVLIKVWPGENSLPSGMVTSLTNSARSQGLTLSTGVNVGEDGGGELVWAVTGGVVVMSSANCVVNAETVGSSGVGKSPVE